MGRSGDTVYAFYRHECEYCRPTTHRYYYHRCNYRDHGGCYKSQRRGRTVARQDTVAVSLISSLKGKPHVEIRATSRRETLISYVATRKIDTIRACVLVLCLSLFLSSHSRRENKIRDQRFIYRFITTFCVFALRRPKCGAV